MLQQVEEGQLLVDNHKLEVLLEDVHTLRRNRDRQYICKVLTIQRAWRAHLERRSKVGTTVDSAGKPGEAGGETESPHDACCGRLDSGLADHDGSESEDSETESAAGGQTMTLSTPEENQDVCAGVAEAQDQEAGSLGRFLYVKLPVLRTLHDTSESESIVSDYSELGGPLKELEKDIEFVDREDLQRDNFFFSRPASHPQGRVTGETRGGE